MRKLTAMFLAVVMTGCSLIQMQTPPSSYIPPAPLNCDKTAGWPLLDTGLAAVALGGGGVAVGTGNGRAENTGAAVALGAVGVVFVVSAIKGFIGTGKCAQYENERIAFIRQQDKETYALEKIEKQRAADEATLAAEAEKAYRIEKEKENARLLEEARQMEARRKEALAAAQQVAKVPVEIILDNIFAESIFNMSVEFPDTLEDPVRFSERIGSHEKVVRQIDIRPGQRIVLTIRLTHMGFERPVDSVEVTPTGPGKLIVIFAFDQALGRVDRQAMFISQAEIDRAKNKKPNDPPSEWVPQIQ